MDWHTIYNKVIAPIRDFLGLWIDWIDRVFVPWTNKPVPPAPVGWDEEV